MFQVVGNIEIRWHRIFVAKIDSAYHKKCEILKTQDGMDIKSL